MSSIERAGFRARVCWLVRHHPEGCLADSGLNFLLSRGRVTSLTCVRSKECRSPSLEPASLVYLSASGFCPETRIFACQAPDFIRSSRRRFIGRPNLPIPSHCHRRRLSISRSPRCHPRSATSARGKTLGRLQNQTTREKRAMSAGLAIPVAESTPPFARQ